MKAYRIQNDIVAAANEHDAIAAWCEHYRCPYNSTGPIEEVPLDTQIQIENADETFRDGTVAEVMPAEGAPAEIICLGECEGCDS